MKILFKFLIWAFLVVLLFLISVFILFSYTGFSQSSTPTPNLEKLNLPFAVNFTEKEKKFLNSLSETDLEKLIRVIKLIVERNRGLAVQNVCNTEACKKQQLQEKCAKEKSQSLAVSTECKGLDSSAAGALASGLSSLGQPKNQSANSQPPAHSGASGLNDTDPNSNPNFNPNFAPEDRPTIPPIRQDQMMDFFQLPPDTSGACQRNFGVNGNMSGIINKIKFDTNCLCIAFGGPIKMVSGYRAGDPRNHGQGVAIDIAENNYRNRSKDSMFVIMLIALGYNIGSYHPGFGSFHADKENSGRWKTWSGVAHTNYQGSYARNYYQQIQDALSLIGTPAISAAQFRATYGNPSQVAMSQKAVAYVATHGNDAMKKCITAR